MENNIIIANERYLTMKSKIIVFLLLITTIVGCGKASDEEAKDNTPLPSSGTNYDDNGGKSPSPDIDNEDEDQDENEDGDEDNDNKKKEKDND
jgi:hypothetical protein